MTKPLYDQPCKSGPRAANDSGPRRASGIDLVVIHSAEAADSFGADNTAEGVARFFSTLPADRGASTQLAVDRDSCVRMLPDLVVPWGAKGANHDGLHVEICGYAKWQREEWLSATNKPMLNRAAAKAGKWCWQYKIPRRWLTVAELRAGKRGLTTHVDVNAAFKGGTHWDPGPHFPRAWFLERVRHYYAEIVKERTR